MIIVPLITVLYLLLLHYMKNGNVFRSLAETWLQATLFIWAVTEILSAFKAWTGVTVFITWLLLLFVLGIVGYKQKIWKQFSSQFGSGSPLRGRCKAYKYWIAAFGGYYLFVLVLAVLSSQYNIDSLVYHLPRIMRWMQNNSVGHFAPGIEFQVRYPCLSEYLVAQFYLLGASDRLANLVQTAAYLCSSVMVFGISRRIGASGKAAFTASAVYLFMPMALAQAYSTQTDDIAGMFLLVYLYILLDFIEVKQLKADLHGLLAGAKLAASVMLGYLCKPTICFVMVVFFCWMCIVRIYRRDRISVLLKYLVVGSLVAGLLYLPLCVKSYRTYTMVDKKLAAELEDLTGTVYETALGSAAWAMTPDSYNVKNALRHPKRLIITCLQNVARNSTSICFPVYNEKWEKLVHKFGDVLEMDTETFRVQEKAEFFYQDMASNPGVMLLAAFMLVCVILRISKTDKMKNIYILCAVAGFLIQTGLMGYSSYRTRYLVGAMAVLCPMIAVAVDSLRKREEWKNIVIAFCLFGTSIGMINTYSYEIPRIAESFRGADIHQYFLGNPDEEYVYSELTRIIRENGFQTIGLIDSLYLEYPLWQEAGDLKRVENVNVKDVYFSQYEHENFKPDCIVQVTAEEDMVSEGDRIECHGNDYRCIWAMHWYQSYFCIYQKL